uniref:Uncharacterized protein n=1 Tax=Arundo donax TaxID=35708 RepID=A0A0A8ZNE4_ARUDO
MVWRYGPMVRGKEKVPVDLFDLYYRTSLYGG